MTDKTFKLRPKAEADLVSIYQFSLKEWGADKAEAYIREINEAFLTLVNNKTLGSDRSYVRPSLRAYYVGSHVVFYKPTVYGVAVIRVLHQSMDCVRHL
ncbi:type II toxin-antitoxin system RelE/ParE family toxin [Hahella aquimaris]|uniref:type II toxin-antitoxin system RelE/ParE family toxin n=1 Tax=Hahella sp. HNIBRBA332 TaxID=3015983 RepID=UPI00273ADA38|nr:type II toxin-antitoxin system RelE/ParE family toxin [Hahella sp. HNIBRBA332]WLQ15421.1 type II toxin-antitoxin system RelE/ParE family toxin [Hahella sp. HNIBRBA332]